MYQAFVTDQAELAAHRGRVTELRTRLAGTGAVDLCAAFDDAVGVGAMGGKSTADAIAEFLGEDRGSSATGFRQIRGLAAGMPPPLQHKLPVLPKAAYRLLQTSDDNTAASELEQIASTDQVLAGRLLGVANSAINRTEFQITSVLDAIMRVGVPEARKTLIWASFGTVFARVFATPRVQELWDHSQLVAQAAYDIASCCGVDGATAYAAGLLHDIGRLQRATGPASLGVDVQTWIAAGFPLTYAETLVYGTDHACSGAELLRQWNISPEIVEAVARHHRPERSDSGLDAVLCLAEDHCMAEPEDLWPDVRRTAACGKLGVDPAWFEALRDARH